MVLTEACKVLERSRKDPGKIPERVLSSREKRNRRIMIQKRELSRMKSKP
jgi:hypothetical protein